MRLGTIPSLTALLLASSLLAGCGGGSGGAGGLAPTADTGNTGGGNGQPQPLPGLYVEATTGDDTTGDGSFAKPFKSITRAITTAGLDETIRVGPGTYDAANGERFPIRPGLNVSIVGSEVKTVYSTIRLTKIVGGGAWSGDPAGRLHAAIVPTSNNRLVGLAIQNPEPFGQYKPAAVVLAQSDVVIESCSLHNSDRGVRWVLGASRTKFKDCTFAKNGIGVFVEGPGVDNTMEGCRIVDNNTGVMLFTGGVDFGGGPFGSTGGNTFTANGGNDLVHFTGANETIFAANCFWDHVPPTIALGNPPSIANADIWILGMGSVTVTGAGLVQPTNPFTPPGGTGAGVVSQ